MCSPSDKTVGDKIGGDKIGGDKIGEHAALLAFGANLGDPTQAWTEALERLAQRGVRITATSGLRETAPVGGPAGQATFLNAAMTVATSLSAEALVEQLLAVEREVGRVRQTRWGPRLIDLDLLLYDDLVSVAPNCVVPHPRMTFRRFMLDPACEVAAEWRHPLTDCSLRELQVQLHRATRCVLLSHEVPERAADGGVSQPSGSWGADQASALLAVTDCLHQTGWELTCQDSPPECPTSELPRLTLLVTTGLHPPVGQVRGPYLCLPLAEPQTWVTEIQAALQAMD